MRQFLDWLAARSYAPNWVVGCLAIVTINWIIYWMVHS